MIWIAGILLLGFLWLFFAPITLDLNSDQGLYRFRWQGIGSVQLLEKDAVWIFRFQLFGLVWERPFRLFSAKTKNNRPGPKRKKSKLRLASLKQWKEITRIAFRAVRCQRFYFNWDTDSCLLNGLLYPISVFYPNIRFNFEGRQTVILQVRTRLSRLIWCGLHLFFIFKFRGHDYTI